MIIIIIIIIIIISLAALAPRFNWYNEEYNYIGLNKFLINK